MDIAFLDSWLQNSSDGSGTAVGIGGLQQALEAQGHRVTRLAPAADEGPTNLTLKRLWFNTKLPALLKQHRFDLIVGFDIDGFLYGWQHDPDTPYLVSIKGVGAEEARQEQGWISWLLWALSRLERLNSRQAQAVLTTSRYCAEAVTRHYGVSPARVKLIPEGIDLARWRRIAAETPRDSDGFTILCVARQYPRKHVADLLHAMPLVCKLVPQTRVVIVGDGPEHKNLRDLARDLKLGGAVQLLGAIPDDDELARLYRKADVFCLPSVQEGFGIVFLEAMASGLPIVSTTAAAIPEVVPPDQAGLLVEPGNVAALAQALVTLLQQPHLRAKLAAFGQQHVEQYDWANVAQLFLSTVKPFVTAHEPQPREQALPAPGSR